jgi:hypothetical protein
MAAFDDPLPEFAEPAPELPLELRADEPRLPEEADDDRLFDALDFGRLREEALRDEPLFAEVLFFADALRVEPLFAEVLRDEPLFEEPLRLPLPELDRVFGLDPFELELEDFFLVPELAWAIFPPWSNAPRSHPLYPVCRSQNALGSPVQAP